MKKLLLPAPLLFAVLFIHAQTNVSGGIYTNTTWLKANSPYIVTDTVVVFPNVTLTIEPGVTVKFADNKRLEIRYATLKAEGTATDSITFTSNSGSPHPGSWGNIWLNNDTSSRFNYCNFRYAEYAIAEYAAIGILIRNSVFSSNVNGCCGNDFGDGYRNIIDSCSFFSNTGSAVHAITNSQVSNCNISNNGVGIGGPPCYSNQYINCTLSNDSIGIMAGQSQVNSCVVKNCIYGIRGGGDNNINHCTVDSNTIYGITSSENDTVSNCKITYNGTGLHLHLLNVISQNIIENNSTGIEVTFTNNSVYCNRICNNTQRNLYYNVPFGNNSTFSDNYWCSNDSAAIAATVYDGYDNINLSLAQFMPIDTVQCYANSCSAYFTLYPNSLIQHTYYAVNQAHGAGALSYVWTWGDGSSDTAAYPSHTYAVGGFYTICLTITDTSGCTSSYCSNFGLQRNINSMVYVNVIPNITTAISGAEEPKSEISIFPNPATSSVSITVSESLIGATATLTDITGRKMAAVQLTTYNLQLTTSDFESGVYFITVSASDGRSVSKKLIIEK